MASASGCPKTLLHHIWLNHPCMTPGHNPGDQLSGALRDPDSQHSKNLFGVGRPRVSTALSPYSPQVKSTRFSGNCISAQIQSPSPHCAYSLTYFHTHSMTVRHLKPQQIPREWLRRPPMPIVVPCTSFRKNLLRIFQYGF